MTSLPLIAVTLTAAIGLATGLAAAAEPTSAHHQPQNLPAEADIPSDSLYQLPIALQTAEGKTIKFADLRGQPLVVTMFYSHCTSVCPLLTAQVQRLIGQLSPGEQQRIQILMVSFDAVRDTPEALSGFKAEHHIKEVNWIIARASANDVRALAAALGIRYRELADHTFNHSAVISVTDREGIVRARTSELTGTDDALVVALRAQIAERSQQPGS
jgi:protein SCO1/2